MALDQLDAFMAHAHADLQLRQQLEQPLDLEAFLALARGAGFNLSEQDVLAAQAREDSLLSDSELQRRAGEDARRLRSFIPA
jgi:predicted ribosomally synthesized peptide with nif11-like leader